jgi:ectoine hydroxylase
MPNESSAKQAEPSRYLSRTPQPLPVVERRENVIWPTVGTGPLTDAQLRAFDRDGILVLEGFFPKDEVESWDAKAIDLTGDRSLDVVTEEDKENVRTIFKVDRTSQFFGRLARDPRILGPAEQILGSQVYVHQSRINYKPGFGGGDFWWHSDFEIWHIEDGMPAPRALSVTIFLNDNLDCNGPIMFVPGSHKYFVPCVNQTPEMDYLQELEKQEYCPPDPDKLKTIVSQMGIRTATGPAGTLVISDSNILHGSNSNMSPWSRHILFYCFNSVLNPLSAELRALNRLQPRPDYLANPDSTPLSFAEV